MNGANGNPQQGIDVLTDFGQAADVSGIERSILGNLILFPKTRPMAFSRLRPEYFYDSRHAVLFAEVQRLYEAGYADDDCQLVYLHLQKRGAMETVGGLLYVMGHLDTYAGVPSAMSRYCQVLREEARRRRQRQIGQRLIELAGRLDSEPAEVARQAVQDLQDPELSELAVDHGSPSAVTEEVIMSYEGAEALARSGRECAGLDTGFPGLNRKLNGLMPAELTVLAARPSLGKSTLAIQIALNVARLDQAAVGFITLEMSLTQVGSRAVTILADVDPERQRRGRLSAEERDRFLQAAADYAALPIHLYQDRTLAAIRDRILHVNREHPVKLWVIDHLHRVQAPGEEYERVSRAAEDLANLSVEIDVPILLLAQLNRQCDERPERRPQMSDLRGSGGIEEHAVNVVLIYRPGFYEDLRKRYSHDPAGLDGLLRDTTLLVEKGRFAPVGPVPLAWLPDRAVFAEPAPAWRGEGADDDVHDHWNN